ncbi:MAG: hypothetical protein QFC55_08420, partial [Chloroflexota bacterium]|nr:hypothetical protein [Chloroflexota bacterium]
MNLVRLVVMAALLADLTGCAALPGDQLGTGEPAATANKDGFVLEMWIDPRQATVGERVFALVRVTNAGNQAPTWETNTCGTGPARIEVTANNEVAPGQAWDGNAAAFKKAALKAAGVGIGGPSVIGHFWEASKIGRNIICNAISIQRPFAPGQVEEAMLAWDIKASDEVAIQAGEATLTSTFKSSASELTATTTIQLTADAPAGASLVDLIDAALGEPAFRAWLEGHQAGGRIDANIVFWPNDKGAYPQMPPYNGVASPCVEIGGFFTDDPPETYGAVVVDLATLRV